MIKPKITDRPIWNQYESRIIELFISALTLLKGKKPTEIQEEDDINYVLWYCLRDANFFLNEQDQGLDSIPYFNAPSLLNSTFVKHSPRELPKPDFQCQFYNKYADTAEESVLYYHIECKRLGSPTSNSWFLNKNYIINGICRFIQKEHSYGLNCKSGLMIGYIQDMTFDKIFQEVNTENFNQSIPTIKVIIDHWNSSGMNQLEHQFDREIEITPFTLYHLWVDLRNNNL